MSNKSTENDLRMRLHAWGTADWIKNFSPAIGLQISQACVDALDQFDAFRQRIDWLENYVKACDNEIKRAHARAAPDVPALPFPFPVMVVCSICGNKRCPHAENPAFECTNSNEPGQIGTLTRGTGQ